MITINEKIYTDVAKILLKRISDENFFNGTIEYDNEEFYSSLTCTLIICRDQQNGTIMSVLPVWWEYNINTAEGEALNDFCWNEFSKYLENSAQIG